MLKIGHRGAMGHAPENTISSFKKALELNVDMVELDVLKCKSGEIVVFHDAKLKRRAHCRGLIAKKTLEELKQLDIGDGQKIPTLNEVLDCIDRKAMVNIELKGRKVLTPTIRIIKEYILKKGWSKEQFLLSCFDRKKLKKMSNLKSPVRFGALLLYRRKGFIKFAKSINAYSVHANYKLVNKHLVNQAHQNNIKLFAWTVNDVDDIKKLQSIGVDGIFSDFPERIN